MAAAAAAAPSATPLMTILCENYYSNLITAESAEAHMASHPEIRGLVRPSSNPNALTLTYRTSTGGIQHTRAFIYQEGPPPAMLSRSILTSVLGTTAGASNAGARKRRSTRRTRKTRRS